MMISPTRITAKDKRGQVREGGTQPQRASRVTQNVQQPKATQHKEGPAIVSYLGIWKAVCQCNATYIE